MKFLIKILLSVLVTLVVNVNVTSAAITFPNIQEKTTSFSFQNEVQKTIYKFIRNDLANCCQNKQNLVDYRNWGEVVGAVAAKTGTAKWGTMQNAIQTGKNQSGEAGFRSFRKELEKTLGMEVDISIIKSGGKFDNGAQIPLKKK